MGGGPDQVTSTTNSEPPAFLKPHLQSAAAAASRRFRDNIGGQGIGGAGGPLIRNAQGLTNSTIQGDFLSPDSNPYLEGTFNRAADLTQGRLASEFAGSGRNLDASLPARSEELQTLASNIFGGNFQQERSRQQGAITDAQGLDPLNMFLNRIASVVPGAGGVTTSTQPVFKQGLF